MPVVRFILMLFALCVALPAAAQNYPVKTIRLV